MALKVIKVLAKGEDAMDKFIGELHKVFDLINHEKFNGELIEPVITVQREKSKKKGTMILGWCCVVPRWVKKAKDVKTAHYEINMTLDYIDRPVEELLATFVHEVAHLANGQKSIKDCNRKQFHNTKFKEMAENLGLVVTETDFGWSETKLSDELWKELQELNENEVIDFDKLHLSSAIPEKEKKPINRKPIFKYRCPHCGKEIKSKSEDVQAKCMDCDTDFVRLEE
jgi:rubrerythrin